MIEFKKLSTLFNALSKDTPNKAPVLFYAEQGTLFGMVRLPRPLDLAIRAHDKDKVLELLKAGADPNLTTDFSGPALNEAVDIDDPEMVKILLAHGADVNKGNTAGATPMHRAVSTMAAGSEKNIEIIKLLLSKDPDLHAKNSLRLNPLGWARQLDRQEAVKLMSAHISAKIERKDEARRRPGIWFD